MTNRDYMQSLDDNWFESVMYCLMEKADHIPSTVKWLSDPYNQNDKFWKEVAEDALMGEDEYWEQYDEDEEE